MDIVQYIQERIQSNRYEISLAAQVDQPKDERRKEMTHVYAPCSLCGGEVVPKRIRYTYHWNGELFLFEDVPAGVCVQCGEAYFTAETMKVMEKIVLSKVSPRRTIRVPVYIYPEALAA